MSGPWTSNWVVELAWYHFFWYQVITSWRVTHINSWKKKKNIYFHTIWINHGFSIYMINPSHKPSFLPRLTLPFFIQVRFLGETCSDHPQMIHNLAHGYSFPPIMHIYIIHSSILYIIKLLLYYIYICIVIDIIIIPSGYLT